jgi:hypothetical protein
MCQATWPTELLIVCFISLFFRQCRRSVQWNRSVIPPPSEWVGLWWSSSPCMWITMKLASDARHSQSTILMFIYHRATECLGDMLPESQRSTRQDIYTFSQVVVCSVLFVGARSHNSRHRQSSLVYNPYILSVHLCNKYIESFHLVYPWKSALTFFSGFLFGLFIAARHTRRSVSRISECSWWSPRQMSLRAWIKYGLGRFSRFLVPSLHAIPFFCWRCVFE